MSTLRQLLSWGSETLEKAEVPDSGQDAWMSVSYTHLDVYKRQM